jgi:hypothetical protein
MSACRTFLASRLPAAQEQFACSDVFPTSERGALAGGSCPAKSNKFGVANGTGSRCERPARDRAVDCSLGRRVRRPVADRRRGGGILSRASEDQHQRSAKGPGEGTNRRPEPGHRGRQYRDERQCGQARVRTSRIRPRVTERKQFQRDRQHAVAKRNARRRATVGDALSAVTVRTRLSATASSLCRTRTVLMLRQKWASAAGTNGGGGSGEAHAQA